MRKKEFRMLVATNPALLQWLRENSLWIKSRPEIMMYLTQHPEAMKHFRSHEHIDNEKIFHNSKLFMNEKLKERRERKGSRKGGGMEGGSPKKKKIEKKGGLLSNLKSMFNKVPTAIPTNAKLPELAQPPRLGVHRLPPRPMPTIKPKPVTPVSFKIPKIKLNRRKLMSTLNQTTEMLDVVGALLGKVSNMK